MTMQTFSPSEAITSSSSSTPYSIYSNQVQVLRLASNHYTTRALLNSFAPKPDKTTWTPKIPHTSKSLQTIGKWSESPLATLMKARWKSGTCTLLAKEF